jgi:hypothetical protein
VNIDFHEDAKDKEFLVKIINKIAMYARSNGYDIDETMQSVANWILAILEVGTFEFYMEGDNEPNNKSDISKT